MVNDLVLAAILFAAVVTVTSSSAPVAAASATAAKAAEVAEAIAAAIAAVAAGPAIAATAETLPAAATTAAAEEEAWTQCMNGVNRGEWNITCDCSLNGTDYFRGDSCEIILLDLTSINSSSRTANFTWPVPPLIQDSAYVFVYKEEEDSDSAMFPRLRADDDLDPDRVYVQTFQMVDDAIARIVELDSGYVNYTVCVTLKSDGLLPNASDVDPSFRNCVALQTRSNVRWDQELAFYIIAGLMLLVVIVLIVLRLIFDRRKGNPSDEKKPLDMGHENGSDKSDIDDVRVIVPNDAFKVSSGSRRHSRRASGTSYQNENAQTLLEHHSPSRDRLLQQGGDATAATSDLDAVDAGDEGDRVAVVVEASSPASPEPKAYSFETESMDDDLGASFSNGSQPDAALRRKKTTEGNGEPVPDY